VECHDVERALSAYVDDELDRDESATLRRHLETCPTCRQRLAALDDLGRLIRRAPYYAAPDTLRARLASTRGRAWRRPWTWPRSPMSGSVRWAAAATIAVAATLAIAALVWRSPTTGRDGSSSADATTRIAETIVDNHVRALVGEHLLDVASTDRHTVKPWFQGRLDFAPPVEDLAGIGFPLIGGRAEYIAGHQAAALVYRRGQHSINLFVWPASTDDTSTTASTSMEARSLRGYHVRRWSRMGMTFWAVSDLNDAELSAFAQALQR
jgi:anti-sigma factor (TIGR02949 family)